MQQNTQYQQKKYQQQVPQYQGQRPIQSNQRTYSPLSYMGTNNSSKYAPNTPKQQGFGQQQSNYQSRDISPQYQHQSQKQSQYLNDQKGGTQQYVKSGTGLTQGYKNTFGNVNTGQQNYRMGNQPTGGKQTSKSPVQKQNFIYGGQNDSNQNNSQFNKSQKGFQQYGQQQQRMHTYSNPNEAEHMYMGNNNTGNNGPQHTMNNSSNNNTNPNSNNINNNRICSTAPNMGNTLDSFSQITGSILDEGVNSNMPASKQITGSKQPLILGGKMGTNQGFFSNYNNSQIPNNMEYNMNYIQQQQGSGTGSNPYLIKNKDTGEVYDIRDYNQIRDEEQASNFLTQNKASGKLSNISQNDSSSQQSSSQQQHNIYRPGNMSQRAHSPYLAQKNNPNYQQSSQQNPSKSLSPLSHHTQSPYSQNPSTRQSNISSKSAQNTNNNSGNNINPGWQQLLSGASKVNGELILMAKINNQEKCVELLDKRRGDKKADVNAKGEDNWTPLHYAALNGNAKLLSFLLYHDAVIDSVTKQQVTPLIIASQRGYDDIFQILMTAGADINFMDINGDTPLHHASRNGNKVIVEMLLRKPSLNYHNKNKKNQEANDIVMNGDIKKVFDDFLKFKKAIMNNHPKLQIYNAQQDKVTQMFNSRPQDSAQNKFNTDLSQKYNQKVKDSNNKSSINSENTTDENSGGGSFNNEEKVGPQHFLVHGLIGKGSFGEVYLVEKKSNNMLYAMKVLHKSKVMRNNLTRYALTERNVLSLTNHPFIVKMQFAFQTPDKLFLILDYCPGGDLGELLQKEKKFTEERVRLYLCEIILALEDLHKRDVIFRDLKPDNIVLDHEGHAKLTDFGLSKEGILNPNTGARSFCGSVAYLAPEMLNRCGHGKAVDWYLLGVVMYEFLVGIPPYYANNRDELFYNIKKAPLKLPSSLSPDAKSLLKALLQRNPAKRLGSGKGDAEEIKQHKYFTGINWEEVSNKKLKPPIPKRKIRISTKFDPNIFESTGAVEEDKQKIVGWSFVAPQHYNN